MKKIKNFIRYFFMFFWNSFFSYIPSYRLRYLVLKYIYRAKLGRCSIHRCVKFFSPWKLTVGDHSNIQWGCFIDCRGGVVIGERVDITMGVRILSEYHDIDSSIYSTKSKSVLLEDYAVIGSYSLILPGVRIAQGTVIGAGSVVAKSTKEYSLYVGNPAVFKRFRSNIISYNPFYKRPFH